MTDNYSRLNYAQKIVYDMANYLVGTPGGGQVILHFPRRRYGIRYGIKSVLSRVEVVTLRAEDIVVGVDLGDLV